MTEEIRGPKRGVSTYSYVGELNTTMTLEDCFQDMSDMGAYGLEILADGIIEGYPIPTKEWLNNWFGLIAKYNIKPVEYGHWIESRLYADHELDVEESYEMLSHDIKLASYLGFSVMRTKLGVIDEILTPVKNWREIIKRALPLAEKYNVVMLPEIHAPTLLKDRMIEEYCEFIDKEQTKHFGFNIDFGVFQVRDGINVRAIPGWDPNRPTHSEPEDIIPLLPYVHCCHAKFYDMNENFEETTIPYDKIVPILKEHGWNGYLLSEYEGKNKDVPGYVTTQLRRHHVMLKRLLGH
jgi:sugar phosphate isomerase/epimerase